MDCLGLFSTKIVEVNEVITFNHSAEIEVIVFNYCDQDYFIISAAVFGHKQEMLLWSHQLQEDPGETRQCSRSGQVRSLSEEDS